MDAKKHNEAYSIGKCLGITPGSLLIPYAYGNLDGANVGKKVRKRNLGGNIKNITVGSHQFALQCANGAQMKNQLYQPIQVNQWFRHATQPTPVSYLINRA